MAGPIADVLMDFEKTLILYLKIRSIFGAYLILHLLINLYWDYFILYNTHVWGGGLYPHLWDRLIFTYIYLFFKQTTHEKVVNESNSNSTIFPRVVFFTENHLMTLSQVWKIWVAAKELLYLRYTRHNFFSHCVTINSSLIILYKT
jgi:hypothetical protein